ncbi:hypothetical protein A374_05946 [Fictibacillus macauensis ZFHKF-1]|uniref:Uncharacterized protein n=1 Tax=Fictibacillus macauensis ZFHKF-1 TaxID=1196324 RepID=I8J3Z8_9BACL|nr:hypothetical protein [Fictibacillus macauensis]EIT86481.1 hypothetical protein A374_05946 [Fictibacillus macauensis ZFHKF-1]
MDTIGSISTRKRTSEDLQRTIFETAKKLVGRDVFLGTILFNYRGRLLAVNKDGSLLATILASSGSFKRIRVDLPLVNQLCPLSSAYPRAGDLFAPEIVGDRWYNIAMLTNTTPDLETALTNKARTFEGKVAVIETDLYNYIGTLAKVTDDYLFMTQIIDVDPAYSMNFRISTNLITEVSQVPYS